ncbi:hypothetical protein C8A03DRAFT_32646 [Achaetomium macrosporum]|uniref:Uncharacterized protein n=1 Tax=Achaetomium macrosporum TaxID=79813 RepID=A0AAN7CDG9_9PEZI|nr:hypothetical protein C8A03DRAFT_32646 [Achaetomium macrosporum]
MALPIQASSTAEPDFASVRHLESQVLRIEPLASGPGTTYNMFNSAKTLIAMWSSSAGSRLESFLAGNEAENAVHYGTSAIMNAGSGRNINDASAKATPPHHWILKRIDCNHDDVQKLKDGNDAEDKTIAAQDKTISSQNAPIAKSTDEPTTKNVTIADVIEATGKTINGQKAIIAKQTDDLKAKDETINSQKEIIKKEGGTSPRATRHHLADNTAQPAPAVQAAAGRIQPPCAVGLPRSEPTPAGWPTTLADHVCYYSQYFGGAVQDTGHYT